MVRSCHKFVSWLLPVSAVVLALLIGTSAYANPGLIVGGAILVTDTSPGATFTHKMTVSIGDSDPATDITVRVGGMGQSLDGAFQMLEATTDTSYSARQFITIDKESFHLEPGTPQDITATIHIPYDVGDGGRYVMINIKAVPAGEVAVGTVAAVNVPIALTMKGTLLTHEGEITQVDAGKAVSGKPVDIFVTFKNTGNHHFKVKGEVTVSNDRGEVLDTIYTALTSSSIIPTMSRQLKATFIPKGELPLGVYSVKSRVTLEDGAVLAEDSGSFEVMEPYVPPPAPASITLTPGSAAILKTGDGSISISFPQGAVISQVEVSLRSYSLEQLPAPPSGFSLATTCFRVDGLTGLLAKEATVTVKYTAADLDKAGGDASRLRLARWDDTDNQWTVLNTELEASLTTHTNRLSIWAVMVAPSAAPSNPTNWPLIGGAAVIIILALPVFFLVRAWRIADHYRRRTY